MAYPSTNIEPGGLYNQGLQEAAALHPSLVLRAALNGLHSMFPNNAIPATTNNYPTLGGNNISPWMPAPIPAPPAPVSLPGEPNNVFGVPSNNLSGPQPNNGYGSGAIHGFGPGGAFVGGGHPSLTSYLEHAPDEGHASNIIQHLMSAIGSARDPELKASLSSALATLHKFIQGRQKEHQQMLQGKFSPRLLQEAYTSRPIVGPSGSNS